MISFSGWKSETAHRFLAMSAGVSSRIENGDFHEVAIGSMMSIQRYEAAAVMPNGSSSSSEPEKRTIPEITTERSFLLTDTREDQRVRYAP